jgi:DNA-directed RNA polymerase specialized sigma24 family protein
MKYSYDLGQKQFDALLDFLSPNPEEAGQRYEHVRHGLVRFFQIKGCADPQGLADETINRGAAKLHAIDTSKPVQPLSYFYGFAVNILKEYRRRIARESAAETVKPALRSEVFEEDREQSLQVYLDRCLEELPGDEKALVMEYYSLDRIEKVRLRHEICERLNCKPSALYTRICRIRSSLKSCIEKCLDCAPK